MRLSQLASHTHTHIKQWGLCVSLSLSSGELLCGRESAQDGTGQSTQCTTLLFVSRCDAQLTLFGISGNVLEDDSEKREREKEKRKRDSATKVHRVRRVWCAQCCHSLEALPRSDCACAHLSLPPLFSPHLAAHTSPSETNIVSAISLSACDLCCCVLGKKRRILVKTGAKGERPHDNKKP